ncbi:MAG: integrase core domain-containing protein [Armatimonadota bacterium]
MGLWNGVTLSFSRPAMPQGNAFIEAFRSRFRRECLDEHWFLSPARRGSPMPGESNMPPNGRTARSET